MTNDDDGSFKLSRRRALASIGTIGAATAAGGLATYAQFTDEEDATMTFTAGGIDGTLSWGATYNSHGPDDGGSVPDEFVIQEATNQQNGVGLELTLGDVKPGDYGSITFGIEVQNNPAWVASCLGIESDTDYMDYEPEIEADDNVSSANVGADGSFDQQDASSDDGEVAENLLIIPFYTDPDTPQEPGQQDIEPLESTFFDPGYARDYNPDGDWDTSNLTSQDLSTSAVASSAAFWNSREGGNDFSDIKPQTLEEAVSSPLSADTLSWGDADGGFTTQPAPDAVAEGLGDGCVFVDGDVYSAGDPNAEDGGPAGAVQPGDTIYFGYDWHIPFGVGNEMQGDKLEWNIGFNFSQIRHTESASLSNIFAPGANTPDETPE